MSSITLTPARAASVALDRWAWLLMLGGGHGLAAVAVSGTTWIAAAAAAGSATLAVLAIVAGVARHRPARSGPWLLLAAGLGLYWLVAAPALGGAWDPDVLAVQVVATAGHALVLLAVVGMLGDGDAARDTVTTLEALILAVAAALATWFLFVAPTRNGAPAALTSTTVTEILHPAIHFALLVMAARALVRYRRIAASLWLLLAALLASAVADVAGLLTIGESGGQGQRLLLGGSLAANALVAAAALHPSLAQPVLADPRALGRMLGPRIMLVGAATFIAPTLLVYNELGGQPGGHHLAATEVAVGALVIAALVMADLYLLLTRLERALRSRVALEGELERRAQSDSLTALPNRAAFMARLDALMAADRETTALLFCDLDDFKTVNDTLGHAAGDQLLVEVGERLRAATRPVDLAARLGGDEFGILLTGVARRDDADTVAARVLAAFDRPLLLAGVPVSVALSIGLAFGSDAPSASALLHDADLAMYRAKSHGKRRVERYQEH